MVSSTFPSQKMSNTEGFGALVEVEIFRQLRAVLAGSTFRGQNSASWEHFWALRCHVVWQAILHLVKCEQNVCFFGHISEKTKVGMGHLKRTWKDAYRVAGAAEEPCSSELFGVQGADFLRWDAFSSIRS